MDIRVRVGIGIRGAGIAIAGLALASMVGVSGVDAGRPGQDDVPVQLPVPVVDAGDIQFKTSTFAFVRIRYSGDSTTTLNANSSWATDWPEADANFSAHVRNLTGLRAEGDGLALELTDPNLGQYPFVYIVEGGRVRLSDAEVTGLRDYLLGGGFLMADDFWGEQEWEALAAQLGRVFPDRAPVELSTDHEIFRSFYAFNEAPQVPGFGAVQQGTTFEGSGDRARYFGLLDDNGRLMAVLCHNSDFGDAWEHAESSAYPREAVLRQAVPMGINIVVYALSH